MAVTVHSPVDLCFPVCPGWLMRDFQWLCRGLAILNAQDFSFRGNSHLSERSEFGNFPWFLEKFCTFRSAYPRNLNWKRPMSQPGPTGKQRTTGLWTATQIVSKKKQWLDRSCHCMIVWNYKKIRLPKNFLDFRIVRNDDVGILFWA